MAPLPDTQIRRYVLIEYVGGHKDGDTAVVELPRNESPPDTICVPVPARACFVPPGDLVPPVPRHAEYRVDMSPGYTYCIVRLTEEMVARYRGHVSDMVRYKAGPHTLRYRLKE